MTDLIALVNEQADDPGLWFLDATCSEAYLQAALRKLHAAIETAPPSFDITDDALNAHLRATEEWVNPHEAETECGVEIECGMTQEAADQINAEQREWLRKGYVAAAATGFFAQLTPEQQKAALEYDGPDSYGDADSAQERQP